MASTSAGWAYQKYAIKGKQKAPCGEFQVGPTIPKATATARSQQAGIIRIALATAQTNPIASITKQSISTRFDEIPKGKSRR
jgi:hypothetical protein